MVKLLHAARCGRFWRQITNLWLIATDFVKNIKGCVFGIKKNVNFAVQIMIVPDFQCVWKACDTTIVSAAWLRVF